MVCHMAWAQAIFGPVARAARLPLVFWAHGATDGRHWLDRWARMTPPDLTICNSHFTADIDAATYVLESLASGLLPSRCAGVLRL